MPHKRESMEKLVRVRDSVAFGAGHGGMEQVQQVQQQQQLTMSRELGLKGEREQETRECERRSGHLLLKLSASQKGSPAIAPRQEGS
jgi:hypothetical protein